MRQRTTCGVGGRRQGLRLRGTPQHLARLADTKSSQEKYAEAEKRRQAVEMHRRVHGTVIRKPPGANDFGNCPKSPKQIRRRGTAPREALAIFREYYAPEHDAIQSVTKISSWFWRPRAIARGLRAHERCRKRSRQSWRRRSRSWSVAEKQPNRRPKGGGPPLIRRATEGFAKVAVDYPDDLNRRGDALYGYILAIQSCVAVPGFAGEVDELNRRLEAEIPQLGVPFPTPAILNGGCFLSTMSGCWRC